MTRTPCCEKVGLRRGRWTAEEDSLLINYIQQFGEGSWKSLPKNAGLSRCGKSCRLRWINYLRSDLKRGNFTIEEEETIIQLHRSLGNRWSMIASHLPGRTDNEVKNYWNSHLSRKLYSFTTSSHNKTINGRGSSTLRTTAVDLIKMSNNTTTSSKRRGGGGGGGGGCVRDKIAMKYNKNNPLQQHSKKNTISKVNDYATTTRNALVSKTEKLKKDKDGEVVVGGLMKEDAVDRHDVITYHGEELWGGIDHTTIATVTDAVTVTVTDTNTTATTTLVEVGPYEDDECCFLATNLLDRKLNNEGMVEDCGISDKNEGNYDNGFSSLMDVHQLKNEEFTNNDWDFNDAAFVYDGLLDDQDNDNLLWV